MSEGKACPVCRTDAIWDSSADQAVQPIRCQVCGDFDIDLVALSHLESHQIGGLPRYLLSGQIRTHPLEMGGVYRVTISDAKRVTQKTMERPSVAEQQLWVLRWLGRARQLGKAVECDARTEYTSGYCQNMEEWLFLVDDMRTRGLLAIGEQQSNKKGGRYTILSLGWNYIDDHSSKKTKGDHVFVAMWFHDSMNAIYEKAIEPGVRAAGYEAKTIREHHFNEGIADRIKAAIRQSRFVIADHTGNRGGVYYEAGFAEGLGIPVINMCEAKCLDPKNVEDFIHFDVRHLNLIDWTREALDKLSRRIQDRIEGTIGRGSRQAS